MTRLKLPERIYVKSIVQDLKKKMVFIGGPRQVGKTTLAQSFLHDYHDNHAGYLNWDNELHRSKILKSDWDKSQKLIVFDEVHKKKGWQSLIKGIYDVWKNTQNFIITGSARLNTFRKSGDSMLGRYHYYCIHPFTLSELGINQKNLIKLFIFGGFPEPLLEADERELRRWHLGRISKLVRIDLRDLESVSDLDKIEQLAELLPSKVGSLLSYKSISEDLLVSDKTIKKWIQILDSLYYCYLLHPYGAPKIKALKKTPKLYMWDWSQVADDGYRFENMVASHLLKYCDYMLQVEGYKTELRYLRDETGKECDFVVLKNNKPLFAVECKLNSSDVSPSVIQLMKKVQIGKWYQVYLEPTNKLVVSRIISPQLQVLSFSEFCKIENLV